MSRYSQSWCDSLREAVSDAVAEGVEVTLLYVVTDTSEGKVAFHLEIANGAAASVTEGKLPRGQKADVTITIKEPALVSLWDGSRMRDEAFMAGDIKVEGAYQVWLDQLVPLFQQQPWKTAWQAG